MKLIALGDNVIDYYRNTQECFPGGNAVNVAVHAARLGAQAEYLGSLGDDKMVPILKKALEENNVDTSHCPILPGHTTKVCVYDVLNGERSFVRVVTGESWTGPLRIGAAELAELKTADLIVSSCNAKMPEQMAAVQALPAIFAYDFGEKEKYRTADYYDAVCHNMDLALLSCKPMDEAAFADLCAPLHRRGVVHVLATMGAAGQMLSVQGKIIKKTTQMVNASDTMGAGDSFLAAFLCSLYTAGWHKGMPMPEQALLAALEAGQQVSARNCMVRGGFGCKAEIS
ncbi:MAG: carbohydrate kinase [Oscillospiraceae bacterium]|nr:carbohydrate kinase [Oscillospiraceae bacterium]